MLLAKVKNNLFKLVSQNKALFFASLVTLAVKLIVITILGDIGWEPDSYLHFLQVRTVFVDFPHNLDIGISVWAKPLYTYFMAIIVSFLGIYKLVTIQVVNILIVLLTGIFTYAILQKLKLSTLTAVIAFILVNFSFLTFRSSLTVLTEPIFTLLLVSAYYVFLRKHYSLSALLVGISVLGRIEGLFFVILWCIFLIIAQRWQWKKLLGQAVLLIAPTLVWNFIGFLKTGTLLFLLNNGYPTTTGVYGFGIISHYFEGFVNQEPLLLVLLLLSVPLWWKWFRSEDQNKLIPVIIFLGFFIVQNVLWMSGLFGTAGLMRYFVTVMPFMVILAAFTLDAYLVKVLDKQFMRMLTGFIVISLQIVITMLLFLRGEFQMGLYNRPFLESGLRQSGEWVRQQVSDDKKLYATRPSVIYYADRDLTQAQMYYEKEFIEETPGIYQWSPKWANTAGVDYVEFVNKGDNLISFDGYSYLKEL